MPQSPTHSQMEYTYCSSISIDYLLYGSMVGNSLEFRHKDSRLPCLAFFDLLVFAFFALTVFLLVRACSRMHKRRLTAMFGRSRV